jgi:hypothetical protein
MQYVEQIMSVAQPACLVYLAFDGVVPEAKIAELRGHSFLAEYYKSIQLGFETEVCTMPPALKPRIYRTISEVVTATPFDLDRASSNRHQWAGPPFY